MYAVVLFSAGTVSRVITTNAQTVPIAATGVTQRPRLNTRSGAAGMRPARCAMNAATGVSRWVR
jgi:hypothetical protein